MVGVVGLDWREVEVRLKLHGLWTREIEPKLAICEAALLEIVAELKPEPGPKDTEEQ